MPLRFVTDQFADLSISTAKLAANAVTAAKMDLTGTFNYSSGVVQVATPTNAADAANKGYVDAVTSGLHWKDSARVKTTANVNIAGGGLAAGTAIDGITLVAGDRILVASQSSASENGIYVAPASGAASRAEDMNEGKEFPGAALFVREGTAAGDTGYVCTNDADPTVGTTAITFVQFTGGGALVGGNGVDITGNTISARLHGSGGLSFDGGEIKISDGGVDNDMLAGSIANAKLSNSSVTVTAGTGLTGGGNVALGSAITMNVSGLTNAEIAGGAAIAYSKLDLTGAVLNADLAGSIADSKLLQITSSNKVASSALQLAVNPGLESTNGGLKVKLKPDSGMGTGANGVQIVLDGSTLAVGAGGIKVGDGALANAQISNSAAIAYSKLALTGAILNADLAGSISDSKLDTIAAANKVSGSAVQLQSAKGIADNGGLGLVLEGNTMAVSANGLKIASGGVSFLELGFQPRRESFTGNGSTTAFDLAVNIPDANWRKGVIVSRNGQLLQLLGSGADEVDEYEVSESGGTTTVTFGSAPLSGDVINVVYYA